MNDTKVKKQYQSTADAKKKYAKTEKGKECSKRYAQNNKEKIKEIQKRWRDKKKTHTNMCLRFYDQYKEAHPDFEENIDKE